VRVTDKADFCLIADAYGEKPTGEGRLELVMIVSVTGLERPMGRWAI
jgi:hypothetical protein